MNPTDLDALLEREIRRLVDAAPEPLPFPHDRSSAVADMGTSEVPGAAESIIDRVGGSGPGRRRRLMRGALVAAAAFVAVVVITFWVDRPDEPSVVAVEGAGTDTTPENGPTAPPMSVTTTGSNPGGDDRGATSTIAPPQSTTTLSIAPAPTSVTSAPVPTTSGTSTATTEPATPTTAAVADSGTLAITAVAGPICPVQTDPPQPNCGPIVVDGADVIVVDGEGLQVARGSTDEDGTLRLAVPAGDLTVVAQPMRRFLGTAPPVAVAVAVGQTVAVTVEYDTGIR